MFRFTLLVLILVISVNSQSIQVPPKEISEPWNPGSQCVPMDSFTDSEMAGVCRDYLSPYYNLTYTDYLTPARLAIVQTSAQIFFLFPEQCGFASIRWVCATMFPECKPDVPIPDTNDTLTVNMQRYSCRTLCEDVTFHCYDAFINILGATPEQADEQLVCDPPGLVNFFGITNRTIFPIGQQNNSFTVTDIPNPLNYTNPDLYWSYNSTCFDDNRFLVVGEIPITCPNDYGFVEGDDFCAFKCPYPIISEKKYVFLWAWTGSLAFISMMAGLFVLSIYICLSYFRQTIIVEIYNILIASVIYSFAFFIALPIGYKEMWCSGGDPNLWGHPGCTIQGILIAYSLWMIVLWWFTLLLELAVTAMIAIFTTRKITVLSFHDLGKFKLFSIPEHGPIFQTIGKKIVALITRREYQPPEKIEEYDLHLKPVPIALIILIWGISAIPIIIALGAQKIGFSGGDAWCTIHANENISFKRSDSGVVKDGGSDPDGWNLGLLTLPLTLLVLIGTILVIVMMITYTVIIMKRTISSIVKNKKRDDEEVTKLKYIWIIVREFFVTVWFQTKNQKRLIVFVIIMLCILIVNLLFRIVFSAEKPEMIDELGKSMTCFFSERSASFISIPGTITPETIADKCNPTDLISYWLWALNATLTGMTGLFIACIFGCNRQIPKQIYYLCICKQVNRGTASGSETELSGRSNSEKMVHVQGRLRNSSQNFPYNDSVSSSSEDSESSDVESVNPTSSDQSDCSFDSGSGL